MEKLVNYFYEAIKQLRLLVILWGFVFDVQQVFISADPPEGNFRKPPRLAKPARYRSYDGHVAVKDIMQVKNGSHYGKSIELLFMVGTSSALDKPYQISTHLQHKYWTS